MGKKRYRTGIDERLYGDKHASARNYVSVGYANQVTLDLRRHDEYVTGVNITNAFMRATWRSLRYTKASAYRVIDNSTSKIGAYILVIPKMGIYFYKHVADFERAVEIYVNNHVLISAIANQTVNSTGFKSDIIALTIWKDCVADKYICDDDRDYHIDEIIDAMYELRHCNREWIVSL